MRILLSVLLILLLVPGWSGEEPAPVFDRDARLVARPIAAPRRIGRLALVGLLRLESPSPAFGGFSAIALRDGRATLLSDSGNWLRFGIARGRLVDARIGVLPDGPGTGWLKEERDSESLALDPATGTAWVGFETDDAIWRYDAALRRAEAHARPAAMRRWPVNGGAESLVRLRDGRFVAIREVASPKRPRAGLIFPRDPTSGAAPRKFAFVPPPGYDPSDACELPNGDLLVLTRRFELPFRFSAKLVRVRRSDLERRIKVRGTAVATLAGGAYAENWEGVAAVRDGARTIVWLVSDSDMGVLQHTALAKFVLDERSGPLPPDGRRAAPEKR